MNALTFENPTPERLDRFLAAELPEFSRARIQSLIKGGHIQLNGGKAKPSTQVSTGDVVSITVPEIKPAAARAEAIPLDILFEDDHLLVLHKAHGMVVHPAAGNEEGTLVNALLHHCAGLSTIGGVERPGIVHRLDKDTSGCMVVAKTDNAHRALTAQFAGREVTKIYFAIVEGRPARDHAMVENHIGRNPRERQKMAVVLPPAGKEAVTEYFVRRSADGASLVECHLYTGRTHQIRVHMKGMGHPILGDPIYARPAKQPVSASRLLLHAWKLGFNHPETGEPLEFTAEPPAEFAPWLNA
ncbi:MAG: RluA family pseudouridine synthase [Verrucomicrobiota bacterium]